MEGGKKAAAVVVLLIIIGLAVWLITKQGGGDKPTPTGKTIEKIDKNTFELVSLTAEEWEKAGKKDGYYKNSKGEYTMAGAVVCVSCQAKVPGFIPPPQASLGPNPDPKELQAVEMEIEKARQDYTCPKCGGKVYRQHRM